MHTKKLSSNYLRSYSLVGNCRPCAKVRVQHLITIGSKYVAQVVQDRVKSCHPDNLNVMHASSHQMTCTCRSHAMKPPAIAENLVSGLFAPPRRQLRNCWLLTVKLRILGLLQCCTSRTRADGHEEKPPDGCIFQISCLLLAERPSYCILVNFGSEESGPAAQELKLASSADLQVLDGSPIHWLLTALVSGG